MKTLNQNLKIYVVSLGCPKNLVDTEELLASLGGKYKLTNSLTQANIIILNTCAFIQPAVEESLEHILNISDKLKTFPQKPLFIVTGCLVNRYGSLSQEFPEVDIWLPIQEQKNLPKILQNYLCVGAKKSPSILTTSFAYLKISEGCNNKCSFCTIPFIRGKLCSLPISEVVAKAKHILNQGKKELILVAQDLTAYGRDLGYKFGLLHLLEQLAQLDFTWIRLLYLYPANINKELLNFIVQTKNILPYFDLPLQHSHPDILQSMGRPFKINPQQILDLIRCHITNPVIRSTFIVGYPGETLEHFQHLKRFIINNKLQYVGLFTYYKENGTLAAQLPNHVADPEKQSRYNELMEIQQKITHNWLQKWEGQTLDIIIDSPHPEWPTLYEGRAWFQAPDIDGLTYVSGSNLQIGQIVPASIEEAKTYDLVALV
ncbi:MAG: 30S ribosomal protein S12 methylthiotransferase RimO [Desulfonauticus sp.]|nr:30S ribosomal protein S12 methylthiotransferase RimO [Desulfonauticus sp.]